MKIFIGMPSSTGQVPIALVQALITLKTKPEWSIEFGFTERVLVDRARNALAEKMLNGGHDYLFFLDDDQIFPPDILMRMMELDKDIVSVPVADRNSEDTIALFDDKLEPIREINEVRQVGAVGMSATLIKRKVLEDVAVKHGVPFRFEKRMVNGEEKHLGEDLGFCLKARELGFEVWAVPMMIWHIGKRVGYGYDPEKNEILNTLI
jgi:GT2 family glycosyltransferase